MGCGCVDAARVCAGSMCEGRCAREGMHGWRDVRGRRDVTGIGGRASCREEASCGCDGGRLVAVRMSSSDVGVRAESRYSRLATAHNGLGLRCSWVHGARARWLEGNDMR